MLNSNWRLKIGKRRNSNELDWHIELHQEFVQFAEEAELLSRLYDWDFWGGGAYERYPLALRWAYEELEERKKKEKISV